MITVRIFVSVHSDDNLGREKQWEGKLITVFSLCFGSKTKDNFSVFAHSNSVDGQIENSVLTMFSVQKQKRFCF